MIYKLNFYDFILVWFSFFRYFMVLIQEMALKIDQGFLGALGEFFTPSTDPEAERQRVTYERNWFLQNRAFIVTVL